jgi:hypothetical protein
MDAWIWIVIAAVAVVLVVAVAYWVAAARRRQRLRQDFGPEYDRTLEAADSRGAAESDLRERVRRHDQLELRELDSAQRSELQRGWAEVQARFVDEPTGALDGADRLIQQAMRARGYPVDDFDQRAADLSVDHPVVVDNYRSAHDVAERSSSGQVTTEELRRAMVQYRSLFEELVGAGEVGSTERR